MDYYPALSSLCRFLDDIDNGTGFIQNRLLEATPELLTLSERLFPEKMKPNYRQIRDSLTGKEGLKFDQVVLQMNSQEVASFIEKVREIYHELENYCKAPKPKEQRNTED